MGNAAAFKNWILDNGLTWRATAQRLDVSQTTVARWASGEMACDADAVERISNLTGGEVTAADMHAARLSWLRTNRPERFKAQEAAE